MAIREILKKGDERLNMKCHPVTQFDRRLAALIEDMKETVRHANGVGLAAPQIGILRRIFVVDDGVKITEYINPEILETRNEHEVYEGCLSIPGEQGVVRRPNYVRIRAQNMKGEFFEEEAEGLIAQAFCHENDHLDGILYDSKAIRMLPHEEEKGK